MSVLPSKKYVTCSVRKAVLVPCYVIWLVINDLSLFLMLWPSGNPLMMYWTNCLPTLWDMGRTRDFAPIQPPTITSPLVKAGRVPLAGITEGAALPTENIQVHAQVSSWSPNLVLSTHECRWCSRSVPLGLYTIHPWTGVVQGQFQLRSQDSGVKPRIMVTNQNWGSPPASTTLSYPFAIKEFLPHLWSTGCVPEAGITEVATLPTKVAVWPDTRALILFGPGGNWTLDLSDEKSALYHWPILTTLWAILTTLRWLVQSSKKLVIGELLKSWSLATDLNHFSRDRVIPC